MRHAPIGKLLARAGFVIYLFIYYWVFIIGVIQSTPKPSLCRAEWPGHWTSQKHLPSSSKCAIWRRPPGFLS